MNATHASHASLNALSVRATLHCLAGCAIGEILGMVLGNALGWSNGPTVLLSVALAFLFGYLLTVWPLLRGGLPASRALRIALAADTLSITIMEIVDNAVMLAIPGAMEASMASVHFWGSLLGSLILAGILAFPANRWLISRGRGHAHGHAEQETGSGEAAPRQRRT